MAVRSLGLTLLLGLALANSLTPQPPSRYTIVIDPGHGGWDPGTVNQRTGLEEKDVTLAISLDLERILLRYGFRVKMFRATDTAGAPPGDVLLNLQRQVVIAKPSDTLFVGIYVNSCPNYDCPGRAGPETYYYGQAVDPGVENQLLSSGLAVSGPLGAGSGGVAALVSQVNRQLSAVLAQDIEAGAVAATGWPNSGTTPAPLYVLRYASIPAALIEVGFMTDPTEGVLLGEPTWQERIAQGIAMGILSFLRHPSQATPPTPLPSQASTASLGTYTVQPGDTLYRLALRFHTTISALMSLNHLCSPELYTGEVLQIP
jgi:N-acetylmuramoyl-L-alanine amidase